MLLDCSRTKAVISQEALAHNVQLVRDKVKEKLIMLLVKANAYGHGAVPIATFLQDRVDYFGVATLGEAVELKKAGIIKPVMIMGNVLKDAYSTIIDYDIVATISSYESAQEINDIAIVKGKKAKVHFAVDTGMSRVGFMATLEEEIDRAVKASSLSNIELLGVFSHLSCADMVDKSYTLMQIDRFRDFTDKLIARGVNIPIRHLFNSAAIIESDLPLFDMVRLGVSLYGLYPSNEVDMSFGLQPVLSWYSVVTQVKTLDTGVAISYGATYVTDKPIAVATVPIGYGDGYPRALSNKGYVLIKGKIAPILGRICMDQMMVDVTQIEGVVAGDTVTLVGQDGDKAICVEELADMAYSFNYEFCCGIAPRVPRVYC